ncbi:hypothetical protein BV22DRAFT_420893 [Leucogyrophana mollusca]|uniref:Uncharacterized protein n=1 Tax=Leucogyrophana mollusca TaxID=85980 RepID=A0ACB8BL92_9AGAM|nr:hypothetical protein BV22DRAFT_420893 [Leucogyrophana mollusca]
MEVEMKSRIVPPPTFLFSSTSAKLAWCDWLLTDVFWRLYGGEESNLPPKELERFRNEVERGRDEYRAMEELWLQRSFALWDRKLWRLYKRCVVLRVDIEVALRHSRQLALLKQWREPDVARRDGEAKNAQNNAKAAPAPPACKDSDTLGTKTIKPVTYPTNKLLIVGGFYGNLYLGAAVHGEPSGCPRASTSTSQNDRGTGSNTSGGETRPAVPTERGSGATFMYDYSTGASACSGSTRPAAAPRGAGTIPPRAAGGNIIAYDHTNVTCATLNFGGVNNSGATINRYYHAA